MAGRIINTAIVSLMPIALTGALTGCGENRPVVEACAKLAGRAGLADGERARCVCADKAARRYLDAANYAALERASVAVLDTDGALPAMGAVVGRQRGAPDALEAATAVGDFLMLAHKVSDQCGKSAA